MGRHPMSILLQKKKLKKKKENPTLGGTSSQTDQAERLARTVLRNLQGFLSPPFPLLCFPWLPPTPTELRSQLHSPLGLQGHFLPVGRCPLESPEEKEKRLGCKGLLQPL